MAELQNLIEKVKSYNPEADLKLVEKAFEFASIAHLGQKRASVNHILFILL